MKFIIDQAIFNRALVTVSKAVSSRPSRPILGNVMLTADDSHVTLVGFDEALSIESRIDAQVETSGSTTFPAKLLGDIISRLQGELGIEVHDDTATITAGKGRYEIRGLPADDYPSMPTIDSDSVELPSEVLLGGLRGTLFAASTDETKQVLTGVHIAVSDEGIELAATDGHRLAIVSSPDTWDGEPIAVTVPTKALREVEKMLATSKSVKVSIDNTQVQFIGDGQTITTRLLQGQYPNYRQLLPKEFARQVTVSRRDLIEALERIAVLASQKNDIVKLAIEGLSIDIFCEATEVGSGRESVMATIDGEPLEIAFNVRYLLDVLKSFSSHEVVMNLNAATTPVVLCPVGDSKVTCLVMPCQIRE